MEFHQLPKTLFCQHQTIPAEDFRVYTANYMKLRLNQQIAVCIQGLPDFIRSGGLTGNIQEKWEDLKRMSDHNKTPDIQLRQYSRDNYFKRLKRPLGMKTGIKRIDDLIGGMDEGTVSVIAGFTSHYKTMLAVNIAYLNAYNYGYNIAYFTLETPKDMMYDQMLARHSYGMKFPQCPYIPHQNLRRCSLTQI
jgi:hypothetical protein